MNTKDEALKLALKALEKLWLLGDQTAVIANPAITAIKQALSAPTVQEPVAVYEAVSAIYFADDSDYLPALWSVVRSLAPGLALLLESNPSAAWHQAEEIKDSALTTPPAAPVQPVVAWLLTGGTEVFHASEFTPDAENNQNGEWTALVPINTPPAAQPAVPLTRERVKEILSEEGFDRANVQARVDFITGFRAAEAAHGITKGQP